jgi:hypothetical protein
VTRARAAAIVAVMAFAWLLVLSSWMAGTDDGRALLRDDRF